MKKINNVVKISLFLMFSLFFASIASANTGCIQLSPPYECSGSGCRISVYTPINFNCTGADPYLRLNSDDALTNRYCNSYNGTVQPDGYCKLPNKKIYLAESGDYTLGASCSGQNVTELNLLVDEAQFTLKLNKGWNLISFPVNLLNDKVDSVFKDCQVNSVWTYDNASWRSYTPDAIDNDNLDSIRPGDGYWVESKDNCNLVLGGSLLDPHAVPPTKKITKGWNLIGYMGIDGTTTYEGPYGFGNPARCALGSLGNYTSIQTFTELNNPDPWDYLSYEDMMDPGAGYWLYATSDGEYVRSTVCE